MKVHEICCDVQFMNESFFKLLYFNESGDAVHPTVLNDLFMSSTHSENLSE